MTTLWGTGAEDCGTHWLGGPEFAIEIVSPGDRTLEKLDFYAQVGTRELLVIDRSPWQLSLYRMNAERKLVQVALSRFDNAGTIRSEEFPLRFRLNPQRCTLDIESGDTLIRSVDIQTSGCP